MKTRNIRATGEDLSMHMADALLSPAVGGTMWGTSAITIAYCSAKVRKRLDERNVPLMGVLGAFLFAAQMINFTIPGTAPAAIWGVGFYSRSFWDPLGHSSPLPRCSWSRPCSLPTEDCWLSAATSSTWAFSPPLLHTLSSTRRSSAAIPGVIA